VPRNSTITCDLSREDSTWLEFSDRELLMLVRGLASLAAVVEALDRKDFTMAEIDALGSWLSACAPEEL
jgi:hypothetical protein